MAYHVELLEARQTLELSRRTASQFVAQLGAVAPILLPPFPSATLGRRPGFQATVLDQKYWFAKLGSAREFDGAPMLRSFPDLLKFHEFGIGHGHAFSLQQ